MAKNKVEEAVELEEDTGLEDDKDEPEDDEEEDEEPEAGL